MASRLETGSAGAGLLIWAAVGLPVLAGDLVVPPVVGWWLAYLAYGVLLLVSVVPVVAGRRRLLTGAVGLQVAAGLAAFVLDAGYGFASVLLVVSAGSVAILLPLGPTVVVVVGQTAVLALSRVLQNHGPTDLMPLTEAVIFAGFQLFAVALVEVALRERRSRAELAAVNLELAAAQSRLAESTRAAERLRIARDMHDVLGHQLTALALNLEVAAHQTATDPAHEQVERSRVLAKQTLAEVREVVGRMREPPFDLERTLRSAFGQVPGLTVHLTVDPALGDGPSARDEALLRCAQEAVTNAVRHAQAQNIWIDVVAAGTGVVLTARDDGRGSSRVRPGHGLTGMRERLEQLGGVLSYRSADGAGFALEARLPAP